METKPHVVVIPFPAQGHVMPLMKLSCCLAEQGFRVTFVNTQSIHAKLMDTFLEEGNELSNIHMVALPEGHTPEERKSPLTQLLAVSVKLRKEFEKLITNIMDSSNSEKIACIIADETVGWALEVARKMGIRGASLFPASAAVKVMFLSIPKLIEMGVIDHNGSFLPRSLIFVVAGSVQKDGTIALAPTLPEMETTHLPWCMTDSLIRQSYFHVMLKNEQISQSADWVLCNSSDDLEQAPISMYPNLLAIGPLQANSQLGNLWPEDLTCLSWLNQQAKNCVIYVAFGSIAILNQPQFDELALALELLERPFLWVVRAENTDGSTLPIRFPDGFQDRVSKFGKIVSWTPQQKVLSHPAVCCFVSHCGWNSTMDGVSTGVPFICWPSFGDQFFNATYITDVWKVGLGMNPDRDGIVLRDEIRRKVNQLLQDKGIKENALKLKQMLLLSIGKGGSSFKNFKQFVEEVKH